MLAMKPEMQSGSLLYTEEKRIPAVEFSNVSLTYKNAGAPSLSNISFRAMPGSDKDLGGTGAGKSSIVNMIPRFYDASEGEVKVFGHDVREYEIESLRSHIGVVPQKAVLFKGTVAENLGGEMKMHRNKHWKKRLKFHRRKSSLIQSRESLNL